MKLLLTSDGLSTPRLRREFSRLVGRPISTQRVLVLFAERDLGYLRYIHATGKELERAGILLPNMEFSDLSGKMFPQLKDFDAVYVCGGNTYFILDRIRKTGLAQKIKKFAASGGIYVGASAGSIIAGADITIAGWGSTADSNEIRLKDLKGLGLTRVSVFPHFVLRLASEVEEFRKTVRYPVVAIKDGEALAVSGKRQKLVRR